MSPGRSEGGPEDGTGGGTVGTRRAAPPVALTVAGSDSGGGAGIQADLKTFHQHGVFGTSALTAVTAQNTLGVRGVQVVEPRMVAAQIHAVAEDLSPRAVKSGMLGDAPVVRAVARALRETGLENYVLDPVMVAASGDPLLEADAVEILSGELLSLADLVTPNLDEAAMLLGREPGTLDDVPAMDGAARELVARGARAVLLKGGHLAGDRVVDVFHDGSELTRRERPRIPTSSTHGTGCTLSAAIAALLARGADLAAAVDGGLEFTRRALEAAPALGGGNGPLSHWVEATVD